MERNIADTFRQTWRALRLPLQSNCSIALDNIFGMDRPEYSRNLYRQLKSYGVKMYGEASIEFADVDYDEFKTESVIMLYDLYKKRHGHLNSKKEIKQHVGAVGRFPRYDSDEFKIDEVIGLFVGKNGRTPAETLKTIQQAKTNQVTPALTIGQFAAIIKTAAERSV